MDKFIVQGGLKLFGTAEIQAAKNAVLPLLAAAVLTDEKVTIHNVPPITDVENMLHILSELGCVISRAEESVVIDGKNAVSHELPATLTRELRSSVLCWDRCLRGFTAQKSPIPAAAI